MASSSAVLTVPFVVDAGRRSPSTSILPRTLSNAKAAFATSSTSLPNASLRAEKSVSLATRTMLALCPSAEVRTPIKPSLASRPVSLDAALADPCLRSHSTALVRSPSTSGAERAFLHSTIGAPVCVRSSLIREVREAKLRRRMLRLWIWTVAAAEEPRMERDTAKRDTDPRKWELRNMVEVYIWWSN